MFSHVHHERFSAHPLQRSCQFLKGVGPVYGALLKTHGIETIWQLLMHIPEGYTIYHQHAHPAQESNALPSNMALSQGGIHVPSGKVSVGHITWGTELQVRCVTRTGEKPWRYVCTVLNANVAQPSSVILLFFHKPPTPIVPGSVWWVRPREGVQKSTSGATKDKKSPLVNISHPHDLSTPNAQGRSDANVGQKCRTSPGREKGDCIFIHPKMRQKPFGPAVTAHDTQNRATQTIQPRYTFHNSIPYAKTRLWLENAMALWRRCLTAPLRSTADSSHQKKVQAMNVNTQYGASSTHETRNAESTPHRFWAHSIDDAIPQEVLKFWHTTYQAPLLTMMQALQTAHFPLHPKDIDAQAPWRHALAFYEILAQNMAQKLARERMRAFPCHWPPHRNLQSSEMVKKVMPSSATPLRESGIHSAPEASSLPEILPETHGYPAPSQCASACTLSSAFVAPILSGFGHQLTPSQQEAFGEISRMMTQETPMTHTVQGDVGSGKTIVGFLALGLVAECGYQGCLLAPTETLVRQHYTALSQWVPTKMVLSQGRCTGPEDAPIILGTHALFYEKGQRHIDFQRLGLVVVDEQQRFGLLQRLALMMPSAHIPSDGSAHVPCNENVPRIPHLLCLSATPIPRTFQRMMQGDLTWSVVEKHGKEAGTQSVMLSKNRIEELRPWMERRFAQQQGVYWVCSTIEDEKEGVYARFAYWEQHFPHQVVLLHGGMSAQEKEIALEDFRQKRRLLLVCTTVIEVGVHVGHATGMIIENAENFGLSQLHQLRGRVGREHHKGVCFFVYDTQASHGAKARLSFMRSCHDGFAIAHRDLLLRGAGEVFGTRQSGNDNTLNFIGPHTPPWIYVAAKKAAERWSIPQKLHGDADERECMAFFLHSFGYTVPQSLYAG